MYVIWIERAVSHLIEIQRFIEQDKPETVRKLTRKILALVDGLVRHPYLGRAGREPETRELIVPATPYIIPYRIHRGRLAILAVLHAARNKPESVG
jgi:toxin ParE1/3/4